MGWTGGQLDGPFSSMAAITFETGDEFASRVLDTARYGTVIYAAVRSPDGKEVFGLVLLAERGDGMLWTKAIPEEMGPAEDDCPARILDLLTETTKEHALNWRRRCRQRLARGRPHKGQTVIFANAVKFTDGSEHKRFTYVGGSRFRVDGREFHIQSWSKLDFEIAGSGSAANQPARSTGPCIVCRHNTADRSGSGGRSDWRCADGEECAVRRDAGKRRPRPDVEVRAEWRRRQATLPPGPNLNPYLPSNRQKAKGS